MCMYVVAPVRTIIAQSLTRASPRACGPVADVDLDDPVNAMARQHEDDAGSIVVMRVALHQLEAELQRLSGQGCHVFVGLWTLVAGMSAAKPQ